jgi:hypothetical protein
MDRSSNFRIGSWRTMVRTCTFGVTDVSESQVLQLLDTVLPNLQIDESAGGGELQSDNTCIANPAAVLLELCHLVTSLRDMSASSCSSLLRVIVSGLSSNKPSSSRGAHVPDPNLHVLILRCLSIHPIEIWEGQLQEAEMAVIMDGLNSPDDTIRKSVCRFHTSSHGS